MTLFIGAYLGEAGRILAAYRAWLAGTVLTAALIAGISLGGLALIGGVGEATAAPAPPTAPAPGPAPSVPGPNPVFEKVDKAGNPITGRRNGYWRYILSH